MSRYVNCSSSLFATALHYVYVVCCRLVSLSCPGDPKAARANILFLILFPVAPPTSSTQSLSGKSGQKCSQGTLPVMQKKNREGANLKGKCRKVDTDEAAFCRVWKDWVRLTVLHPTRSQYFSIDKIQHQACLSANPLRRWHRPSADFDSQKPFFFPWQLARNFRCVSWQRILAVSPLPTASELFKPTPRDFLASNCLGKSAQLCALPSSSSSSVE